MRDAAVSNLCCVHVHDLLALNNKKFKEEIMNIILYPPELTLKRTTESDTTLYRTWMFR